MATAAARQGTGSISDEARQELLGKHIGLVHHVARQLCRGRQMDMEVDDLVGAGTLGLIDAFRNFDPARGLAFSTFAAPRIRGAILDELRRQDHLPRSVRRQSRELNLATEALTHSLGCSPTQEQLAGALGIDVMTLIGWQADGDSGRFIPLERSAESDEGGLRMSPADLVAVTEQTVEDRLTMEQEVALARDAIGDLPEQDRLVLSLYYFEELKLAEIAAILHVSESRVSQIRTRALATLRSVLGPLRRSAA